MRDYKEKSLLSVIVPIYNVDKYLDKCIKSIINQTYSNLEIILVNDGSTDLSAKICDELKKTDDRIVVVHKENGGLVSARKAGMSIATGEYVTYVDGDDWIEPQMYEVLINQIQDADIIISGVKRDYGTKTTLEINKVSDGVYEGKELEECIYKKMLYTGSFYERAVQPHIVNVIFKKNIIKKNQLKVPNEIRVGEDAACLYPTILESQKVVVISDCFYHYQMRDNSIMGMNDGLELERIRSLYFYLKNRFGENVFLQENLIEQLQFFVIYALLLKNIDIFQQNLTSLFPYKNLNNGKRIVVYGAGRFGCELVKYLDATKHYEIILWVDRNSRGRIRNVESIKNCEYDYILVAVLIHEIANDILKDLISMGVDREKVRIVEKNSVEKMRERIDEILSLEISQ